MAARPLTKPRYSARRDVSLKLHRDRLFGEVSNIIPFLKPVIKKAFVGGEGVAAAHVYNIGVTANFAECRLARGGARNSASRESQSLTTGQVTNLTDAAAHASLIGLPFTRFITIHWKAAGVPLEAMAKATGRFVDLMSKALARNGSRTSWLWVHENVPGGKGWHCHLLAHIPAHLSSVLGRCQKRWLRTITGNPYKARVIDGRPIGGRLGVAEVNLALHGLNLAETLSYVLKGANEAAMAVHDLKRLKPGGLIIGKRCGTSQNIGPKARKDYKNEQFKNLGL